MLLERSVVGLTPLRGEHGWSRAAPQVTRPVGTAGWERLRRGRTGAANPPGAASEEPGPPPRAYPGFADPSAPDSRDRGATALPGPAAASLPALGEPHPPGESPASARHRPALTGPAPSPVPDDLPQQRKRLPRRVLGARPLPATPQPRREGLDLLGELRAALVGARHGGSASASGPPPSHWRRLPSCARPPAAAQPMRGASGGWAVPVRGRGRAVPGAAGERGWVYFGAGRAGLGRAKSNGLGKAQFLAVQLFLLAEPEPALDKAGM